MKYHRAFGKQFPIVGDGYVAVVDGPLPVSDLTEHNLPPRPLDTARARLCLDIFSDRCPAAEGVDYETLAELMADYCGGKLLSDGAIDVAITHSGIDIDMGEDGDLLYGVDVTELALWVRRNRARQDNGTAFLAWN